MTQAPSQENPAFHGFDTVDTVDNTQHHQFTQYSQSTTQYTSSTNIIRSTSTTSFDLDLDLNLDQAIDEISESGEMDDIVFPLPTKNLKKMKRTPAGAAVGGTKRVLPKSQ